MAHNTSTSTVSIFNTSNTNNTNNNDETVIKAFSNHHFIHQIQSSLNDIKRVCASIPLLSQDNISHCEPLLPSTPRFSETLVHTNKRSFASQDHTVVFDHTTGQSSTPRFSDNKRPCELSPPPESSFDINHIRYHDTSVSMNNNHGQFPMIIESHNPTDHDKMIVSHGMMVVDDIDDIDLEI